MNCTAWNSLVAKALRKRPSPTPSSAFETASATTRSGDPTVSTPSGPNATSEVTRGLGRREQRESQPVAAEQVELRERQGHQPLERAAGSLAEHRDRRDEEHHDQRKEADERHGDALEGAGRPVEDVTQQHEQRRRHDEHEREGAMVATQLLEDAPRRWRASPGCSSRAPPAPGTRSPGRSRRRGRAARRAIRRR